MTLPDELTTMRRASAGLSIVLALIPLACGGAGTSAGATSSAGATTGTGPGAGGAGGHGGAGGLSSSSGSSGGGTAGSGGQGGSGGSGVCVAGAMDPCYTGPPGTQGVGACKGGVQTCNAEGSAFGACVGQVLPSTETCATPLDDDCNGAVNEGGPGCACAPDATTACYTGAAGTLGVGLCKGGQQTCNAQGTGYGACAGEVVPAAETCLDAFDNDCNGETNEDGAGCVCAPSTITSCYTGPAGTAGVGLCKAGLHTCDALGTSYGPCAGEALPQPETCATPGDDDCNGQVNEGGAGCVCAPNGAVSCYPGPAGTPGVGICKAGTQLCNAQGTALGACSGAVQPQGEICGDSLDNNCDGQVNEGCGCVPGSTTPCYNGPPGTMGVGACQGGTQTCKPSADSYGPCVGETLPQPETCATPIDDDCNGQVNEGGAGCVCLPGSAAPCYSGPAGTAGVGACAAGTKACNGQGTAYGACVGEVLPQAETCSTPVDDDCNGQTNEGGAGCVCAPNAVVSCYSGPAGTAGVGICKAGSQTCNGQGTSISACLGAVGPQAENCATPADEDCDGIAAPCAGTHVWSHAWGGAQDEEGNALAIDAANNVLFAGYVTGPVDFGCGVVPVAAGNDAALLMKLTPGGACTWSKAFGHNAQMTGVAVDPSGNVLATGIYGIDIDLGAGLVTSQGGNDAFIAKYDALGNHLWSKTFGDPSTQTADTVATDSAGNVIALGIFSGTINLGGGPLVSAGGTDLYLVKYSPTGTHLWSKRFGDAVNQSTAHGLAIDPSGNILLTGTAFGTINFGGPTLTTLGGGDTFVAKLDPGGNHLWSKRFGDSTNQLGSGIATDAAGDVVVSGYFLGTMSFGGSNLTTQGLADSYLAKLDPSGNHLWSMRGGGPGNQSAVGVAVDLLGNVSIIGSLTGSGSFGGPTLTSAGGADILIVKYDAAGNHLWSKSFGDPATQSAKGLAADSAGNVLFTGIHGGTVDYGGGPLPGFGGEDVCIVKLGP